MYTYYKENDDFFFTIDLSIAEYVNSQSFHFRSIPGVLGEEALPNSGMHSEANSEVNDKIKDPQLVK